MSTLSFREQAAIALLTYSGPIDAPSIAQGLADACCKAWGHDWPEQMHDALGRGCTRCGGRYPRDEAAARGYYASDATDEERAKYEEKKP